MATQVGIKVDANPSEATLSELGVFGWSVWTKEVSEFPWTYDEAETCYFLEGEVTVTPDGGEPVTVGKGQLVTFPAGMSCTWAVTQPVRKHYKFG
ncbi:MAG: cupin domain-containing protein [Cyanophyceae cyanobacterium]